MWPVSAVLVLFAAWYIWTQQPSSSHNLVSQGLQDSTESIFFTSLNDSISTGYVKYLQQSLQNPNKNNFESLVSSIFWNKTFVNHIWEKKPLLLRKVPFLVNYLSLEEIKSIFEELQPQPSPIMGFLTDPKTFRRPFGPNTDERVITPGLIQSMTNTLSIDGACTLWGKLKDLCLIWTKGTGLWVNMNLYVTPPGLHVSAPPHNDRQDVFILQSSGSKRWKLYEPRVALPLEHQIRGKAGDIIQEEELDKPLLDVMLHPGDILYLPRGIIHATSTPEAPNSHSIHFTLGVETDLFSHTYYHMLSCTAGLLKSNHMLSTVQEVLETDLELRKSLPFGFLALKHLSKKSAKNTSKYQNDVFETYPEIASVIIKKITAFAKRIEEKNPKAGPIPPEAIEDAFRIFFVPYKKKMEHLLKVLEKIEDVPLKARQAHWSRNGNEVLQILHKDCQLQTI